MRLLHIAASLRVVAKHRHVPGISIAPARKEIQRFAASTVRMKEDERLVEELERVTILSIDELATLSEKWLPR